ncbi:hypothetical protein C0J52_09841 [Blattella germanica]|nr:hypothetical protein C0J52_09841 [Blattella germanica]
MTIGNNLGKYMLNKKIRVIIIRLQSISCSTIFPILLCHVLLVTNCPTSLINNMPSDTRVINQKMSLISFFC